MQQSEAKNTLAFFCVQSNIGRMQHFCGKDRAAVLLFQAQRETSWGSFEQAGLPTSQVVDVENRRSRCIHGLTPTARGDPGAAEGSVSLGFILHHAPGSGGCTHLDDIDVGVGEVDVQQPWERDPPAQHTCGSGQPGQHGVSLPPPPHNPGQHKASCPRAQRRVLGFAAPHWWGAAGVWGGRFVMCARRPTKRCHRSEPGPAEPSHCHHHTQPRSMQCTEMCAVAALTQMSARMRHQSSLTVQCRQESDIENLVNEHLQQRDLQQGEGPSELCSCGQRGLTLSLGLWGCSCCPT